jgi:hypothetical protein
MYEYSSSRRYYDLAAGDVKHLASRQRGAFRLRLVACDYSTS